MGYSGQDIEVRSDLTAGISDDRGRREHDSARRHDVPLSSHGQCRGFVLRQ
jgi:hypothetical protein